MKKIAVFIVLFVVFFTAMNTAEVLVAQNFVSDLIRQFDQQQQAKQQQGAIIFGVCLGVGLLLLFLAIHLYIKERDKKNREWQEKRDEEMKRTLAQKPQENKGSDTPDK